jgi:hypothetical protein
MRMRSVVRAAIGLALASAVAAAPARELVDREHGGTSLGVAARQASALVASPNGMPDGELRPGDERDPAPTLPGWALPALLLSGAVALAFLRLVSPGRLAATGRRGPHAPRAPPLSVTV